MANYNTGIPNNAIEAFGVFLDHFSQGKSYVLEPEQDNFWNQDCLEATYQEYCEKSKDKGDDKKFDDVIKAIKEGDKVNREKMIGIINHAVWLWALPNNRKAPWIPISPEKKQRKQRKGKNDESGLNNELLKIAGVAGGGSGYVQTKTNGVRFILYLFTKINKAQDSRQVIEIACQQEKYPIQGQTYDVPEGVKNLLLHLCYSDKYAPIAAIADKKKIVRTFWNFLDNESRPQSKKEALERLDETIIAIRKMLSAGSTDFSFYENSLPLLWKGEKATDLSLVQKLEYKKAMILYGPPGTSKTYTAKELAVNVIFRYLMNKSNEVAIELLKKGNLKELLKERIKILQFHINYNYEDFIAGQTIKNQNVETRPGFIFDVVKQSEEKFKIKKIDNKEEELDGIPYVVILDEINRTDISRVFGELFSAIENRGEDVDLTLPNPDGTGEKLKLNIPENIYFIGTMNEIDFSLERVDFALRRRFIWELHDYKEDTLKDIIYERLDDAVRDNLICDYSSDISISETDSYCKKCTEINKKVEEAMGEAYHIGHAFFAEVADIYIKLKSDSASDAWKKAKEILWEISIKPTLEAYCGSMERNVKEQYLKDKSGKFYNAFFDKEEQKEAEERDTEE